MPSTLSLLLWATVASASTFMHRVVSPDEDAAAEIYRRNGRGTRIPTNVQVSTSSSSTTCTTGTRTVVVPSSSAIVEAQATARGGFKAKTKNGGRTKPAQATPSAAASVVAPDVDLGAVVVESNVATEPTPAAVEPQATQPGRGAVFGKGGRRIRTKSAKLTPSTTAAAASSVVADADSEVVAEPTVAPAEVSSAEPASTAAAEPQPAASSSTSARGKNRRPTRKATKTRPGKTTAAAGTTVVAPQDVAASSSIALTSASEVTSSASSALAESSVASSSSAAPAVTGATGIPTANPTTPVPVSRAGGVLQPSAAAESHQRDAAATRAFSDVEIRAPNGQCLFIDPTAGDFRQNLIPISLVDCSGSPNEKWDIVTAGKHNKPGRKPATLVVSTLTQGCIAFDGRRQAGDTVTLFSCGGRADGSGETSAGQQFPYLGQLSFAFAPVSERNTTCILPGNGRLESGPCPTDGSQLFSIFP